MVVFTPGRTASLAVLSLGIWASLQWQDFRADVAAFRAHAAEARRAAPAATPAAAAIAVPLSLPLEPGVPPAYSTDSVVPLVYRVGPDEAEDPYAVMPANDGGPFLSLSWSPPDDAKIPPGAGPPVPLTLPRVPAAPETVAHRAATPETATPETAAPETAYAAYAALAAGETARAADLLRQAFDAAPSGQLAADLAYASLRLGRRREAAIAFRSALYLGAPTPAAERRWRQDAARLNRQLSVQGYAFFRKDDGGASAAPVTVAALGQSQSALTVQYKPEPLADRPLVLQARLLAAHDSRDGAPLRGTAQATAGLGWVILPAAGGTLAAERWIGLGRDARDAFALRAYGGRGEGYGPRHPGERLWPHWSLFGEAAMVGLHRRDLFAGGEARAGYGLALGEETRATVTAALWGMVQHDDRTRHRLEAGPSLGLDAYLGPVPVQLRLDYRFPLSATPDSGRSLALTVAAGF